MTRKFGWLVLLSAAHLWAHTASVSYAEISVVSGQMRWVLTLPLPELNLLFALDTTRDGIIEPNELKQGSDRIRQYLRANVSVLSNGVSLKPDIGAFTLWHDPERNTFARTEIVFSIPGASGDSIVLHCDLFRSVFPLHRTVARINFEGGTQTAVFENGKDVELKHQPNGFEAALQFVRMGVLHIFTGYDHIAFLLGVVLMGGNFKSILKMITSFTVAHSITLALAALNIVILPSRIVECGIALSIMYVACENLLFKEFDRRWIVTFFFGLVHGFGFASALREVDLSGRLLGTALVSFNLGVEAGQVCIVAILLPMLWYVAQRPIQTVVLRTASVCIFLLGSFWFWQRLNS